MKFRLSFKAILIAWFFLLIIFAAIVVVTYSKFNPDSLTKLLELQIEKIFPGSRLFIGKIDYNAKLDFSADLMEMKIQKGSVPYIKIQKLKIRFPWWLLIFNAGEAQVSMDGLEVFLDKKSRNTDELNKDQVVNNKRRFNFEIPRFVSGARYTLRAKNISIRKNDEKKNLLIISKLLVKEFNYSKNSSFELSVPISINHQNEKFFTDLWLFGELAPHLDRWSIQYRAELKTKDISERTEFSDIALNGKAVFSLNKMDISSDFDFLTTNKKVGNGSLKTDGKNIILRSTFSSLPLSYFSLLGSEIKTPYLSTLDGVAQGEFNLVKSFKGDDPINLQGKVHFPGIFGALGMKSFPGGWKLSFENNIWHSSFISPEGDVRYFRRAVLDFTNSKINQHTEELEFKNLELMEALAPVKSIGDLISDFSSKPHTTLVVINNCRLNENIFNGTVNYGVLPDSRFIQLNLVSDKSKLMFNYQQKMQSNQLEALFKNFEIGRTGVLFSPILSAESGTADGSIKAKWVDNWHQGDWVFKIDFKNFEKPEGRLIELSKMATDTFPLPWSNPLDLSLEFNMAKEKINLKQLVFPGVDPAVMSGTVRLDGTKSLLNLNYPKNKKWKTVKKEAVLDFALKGSE